jgi:ankyrin repeat protein
MNEGEKPTIITVPIGFFNESYIQEVKKQIEEGKIEVIDEMYDTFLHYAVKQRNFKDVKFLLNSPNIDVNAQNLYKRTPLHSAVIKGDVEIADLLIKAGADINFKDENGDTPLHVAVVFGRFKMIQFLINAGASTNIKNIHRETPWAIELYHHRQVMSLFKIGFLARIMRSIRGLFCKPRFYR